MPSGACTRSIPKTMSAVMHIMTRLVSNQNPYDLHGQIILQNPKTPYAEYQNFFSVASLDLFARCYLAQRCYKLLVDRFLAGHAIAGCLMLRLRYKLCTTQIGVGAIPTHQFVLGKGSVHPLHHSMTKFFILVAIIFITTHPELVFERWYGGLKDRQIQNALFSSFGLWVDMNQKVMLLISSRDCKPKPRRRVVLSRNIVKKCGDDLVGRRFDRARNADADV